MGDEPTPTRGRRRRHHLVSAGYQRNFARGEMVSVVNVSTGECVERSVRRNWFIDDYLTLLGSGGKPDDRVEEAVAKRERVVLNQIRHIDPADFGPTRQQAVIELAAMHLARSESFLLFHLEIAASVCDDAVEMFRNDPDLTEMVRRDQGREPEPGELEGLVREHVSSPLTADRLREVGFGHTYNRSAEFLGARHLQLVAIESDRLPGFVLADQAVVHARAATGQYGFKSRLALGDSTRVLIPISRRSAVLFSSQRLRPVRLTTKTAIRSMNALMCRAALREVLCHPDDTLDTTRLIRTLDRYPPDPISAMRARAL